MKKIFQNGIVTLLSTVFLIACGGGGNSDAPSSSGGPEKSNQSVNATDSDVRETTSAAAAAAAPAPALAAVWRQLPNPNYAQPAGPYVRAWTEMLWDPLRREIVVFGGNGPDVYNNDIWSYNGATANWTLLAPQTFCPGNNGFTQPNGTDDSNFKYDPVNNLYWIFGAPSGYRCFSYTAVRTAAAGSSASTIIDPSLTGSTPGAYSDWRIRTGNTDVGVVSYNPTSKTLALDAPIAGFGPGTSYQLYATTGGGFWYFNPVTKVWVGQNTPAGNIGPTPTLARFASAVDYSSAAKAFVLFAGDTGSDRTVWKLDVTTKRWTNLPVPATGAPPHLREMLNSFVYDKQSDVFILFGGQCASDALCPDGILNGQTWAYRLSTNTWINMNPPTAPGARAQQVMTYDSDNGVTVLFGGVTQGGSISDETWTYHYPSNTWTRLAPAVKPAARYLAQIAYDPQAKRTVIFGGASAAGSRADIWGLTLTPVSTGLPTVNLTSPVNGTSAVAPANFTLSANAADTNGTITKVEFFTGTTKLGEDLNPPYALNWNSVPAGTYSVTAVVTDNSGATATSVPVNITVTSPVTGPAVNVALQTSGGVASASSIYSAGFPAAAINDGVLNSQNLRSGGVWADATLQQYPDWVQVMFNGVKSINRIDVVTLPDDFAAGTEPTPTKTFTQYGITSFNVQYWTGSAWVTVPGGSVTGNNLVWRTLTFPAVNTDRIRVLVNGSTAYGRSFISEIQAWSVGS